MKPSLVLLTLSMAAGFVRPPLRASRAPAPAMQFDGPKDPQRGYDAKDPQRGYDSQDPQRGYDSQDPLTSALETFGGAGLVIAVALGPHLSDAQAKSLSLPGAPQLGVLLGLSGIGFGLSLGVAGIFLSVTLLTALLIDVSDNQRPRGLMTSGVYSLCRHPLYSSAILGCGGLSLVTLSFERLVLTAGLYTLLLLKSRREEESLLEEFGEAYGEYAYFTPSLIPERERVQEYLGRQLFGEPPPGGPPSRGAPRPGAPRPGAPRPGPPMPGPPEGPQNRNRQDRGY